MFAAGNYAAAERLAREALSADPNASGAHTLLSRALSGQGRAKPALSAALDALAIAPNAPAFHAQAVALRALGRRREAVAAARDAVKLAPLAPGHVNLLGIVQEEAGSLKDAEASLLHAMSLAVGQDDFRASYGLFLLRHRRLQEAERVALDMARGSDLSNVLLLRGKIAVLRDRPAEARDFALWILARHATDRAALGLLVEAKAGQSQALRLWWRYRVLLATGPRWVLALLLCGLLFALLAPGLQIPAFAFVIYSSVARRTFRRWLDRELRGVTLSKRF